MKKNTRIIILMTMISAGGIFFSQVRAIVPSAEDRAEKNQDKKIKIEEKKTDKLCVRIDNVVSRLEKYLDSDRINLRERVESRVREMEENRDGREAELAERRKSRDEARNEFYQKLDEKSAQDDTKKAAVEEFKSTVEKAVETRRLAIDNAKDIMNSGITQAIANRETNTESLRAQFKSDVDSAIAKAKNSCDEDATSDELKEVLSQLREDVKNARDTYKNKIGEEKKVQEDIGKLREERKLAVKTAIENFKATMKTAQEQLRNKMALEEK